MKTYILVHHATGNEIELKADEIRDYPECYAFRNEDGLIIGQFSKEHFSFYAKEESVWKSKDDSVIFNLTDGIIICKKPSPPEFPKDRTGHTV